MKLNSQVAIITGGGGAIGGAIARKLAAEGATMVLFDIRAEYAENNAKGIRDEDGTAEPVGVDITNEEEVHRIVEEVFARYGRIDILVNCAGGSAREKIRHFHEQSLAVVRDLIGVNLFGALNCIHAVSQRMLAAKSGKIINIASILGIQGRAGFVEYSAAKGAIIAATKSLAKELGPYNINVNAVSPGQVPRDQLADPDSFARLHTFLNRVCTPDDIAELVRFLTLPEAAFITGQNYVVDGGRSLAVRGSEERETL